MFPYYYYHTPPVTILTSLDFQYSELFQVSSIFREAVKELLPNIPRRLVYSALKAKLDKDNDKITVRTKAACLAKIKIARDFARCKIVGVIITLILDHNRTYKASGEKMEVPVEWIQSSRMDFTYSTPIWLAIPKVAPALR